MYPRFLKLQKVKVRKKKSLVSTTICVLDSKTNCEYELTNICVEDNMTYKYQLDRNLVEDTVELKKNQNK